MPRPAALCAALLALAACDAGAPPPEPDALVGTWTFASVTTQELATVTRTQEVVDRALPSEGALTLDGAAGGPVADVHEFHQSGPSFTLTLASWALEAPGSPPERRMVFIQEVDGQTSVAARTDSDATGETHEYEATGHPSVRRGAAFTLDHTLASTTGSGATLRVSGTFALGRRTLAAGSPSLVSERIYEPPPGTSTRYVFAADGGLRVEDTVGGQAVSHVGTWARAAEGVTLTLPAAGGVTALTYRVEASGSELRLVRDSVDGPCDVACRARAEGRLAIERATLSDFRRTETLRLRAGA